MTHSITNFLTYCEYRKTFLTFFLATVCFNIFPQSKQSDHFFTKGIEFFETGEYAKAIECFSKADKLDLKQLPPESSRGLYSKSWIAHCYYKLGNVSKAKEYYQFNYEKKPINRNLTVKSDIENDLAYEELKKSNLDEALTHALNCLQLEEQILGKESLHYIGSCCFIADIYSYMHDYNNVIKYCDLGLSSLEALDITSDSNTYTLLEMRIHAYLSMNLVAMTYRDLDRLETLCINDEYWMNNSRAKASLNIMKALVELRQNQKDDSKIYDYIKQAFYSYLDIYDPNDEFVFNQLSYCVKLLEVSNGYDLIFNLLKNAIAQLELKNLSNRHKGLILSVMGSYITDIDDGYDILIQASDLLYKCADWDGYFNVRSKIGIFYQEKERYQEALDIYTQICEYYKSSGNNTSVYRRSLMRLGDLYFELGNITEAASQYKRVLDLFEDNKSNPYYILSFFKWIPIAAEYYKDNSSFEPASMGYEIGKELSHILEILDYDSFIENGISIVEVADAILQFYRFLLSQGSLNTEIPWSLIDVSLRNFVNNYLFPISDGYQDLKCQGLSLIAKVNYLLGNDTEAISLINKVIDIAKERNWTYENYIHDLAYYQYDSGDCENAYPNFRIGYDFLKEELLKHYRWMTLEERVNYTNFHRGNIDNMSHYAEITPQDSRYAELGYDALLFTKGLLLNSSIELTRLLQEEGDKDALKLLDELRKINLQIETAKNTSSQNLETLKYKSNSLEKLLLKKSKSFGDYTDGLNVSWQDVQLALGVDDVAVEFCSYQKSARARQYGAIILTKDSSPLYVDLGKDSDWQPSLSGPDAIMDSGLFVKILSNLIPFLPSNDKGVVYFAPDGLFHMIPIENLPGAESFNLRRLSSTRELALNKNITSKTSSIVLFGGADYGLGEVASFYGDTTNGKRASSEFLEYLPGTLEEVNQINGSIDGRLMVDVMTGKNATKTNFMKYSGKRPDVVHVATHGFFSDTRLQDAQSMDPMACSGLYFAGAQNTLWDMDTKKLKDNGILTAQEISSLDLRGVKLAVLSACDSGRGSITPDGVFGLQRGFKQAGVQSLMISLWKVDDEVTKMLMTEFYNSLLNGLSLYEALKVAQSITREAFPDSKDWAAFVLIDANNGLKL